jgi:hypothetical protein
MFIVPYSSICCDVYNAKIHGVAFNGCLLSDSKVTMDHKLEETLAALSVFVVKKILCGP